VFTHLHISFLTEEFENIKYKADPQPLPPREIPPYNGFGSEEDSLATCLSLRPKPTRRDFKKFMEKDRLEETNATSQNIHILTLRLEIESKICYLSLCLHLEERIFTALRLLYLSQNWRFFPAVVDSILIHAKSNCQTWKLLLTFLVF